jgi:hypothetical protein
MTVNTEPTRAPSKALYLTDYARATWDIAALSVTLPALARAPRGDGHAVLVIPGLGASDVSTLILRRFLKDHAHSNARRAYELLRKRHTETIQLPLEAGLGPLPVPATSVYTRLYGIVAWRACLDQPSRHAENVEVYASHSGIGNHPAALWVIADRLTQAPGKWAPFRPPARWRCAYPTPNATDPVEPS